MSFLPQVVKAFLLVAFSFIAWNVFKRRAAFSIIDKIPGPKASSWLKGNFIQIFGTNSWDFHDMMRERYGPTSTFHSLFGDKYIYTFDPKAMHHILIKDQYTFEEQRAFILTNQLLFGKGLLSTLGEHHRRQRKMLNPVFSIAHMREMIPTFNAISLRLRDSLAKKVQDGPEQVDMLSWLSRTALELVGQSGLGYSFDPLTDEECAHPYPMALKGLLLLVSDVLAVTFWSRTYILPWLMKFVPAPALRFLSFYWPSSTLRHGRELADYMWELSTQIYQEKKRALDQGDEAVVEQVGRGKDILSVLSKRVAPKAESDGFIHRYLVNENMKASDEDKLDEDEIIGQSALARILLLLAEYPSVQARLREELNDARRENQGLDLGYDQLISLPYLDSVCRETLRLYPPVPRLMRTTIKDTVLPLSTPVTAKDGSQITEIPVPAQTNVYLSIMGSNRNTSLWGPDAPEWKPERWLSPLPDVVSEAKIPGVYSHLMTFNGGGRSCIGFKFSQLEMKVVLAHLVETFEFAPSGKHIDWNYTGVSNPYVPAEGRKLQLPIRMNLVNRST
ncbi:hypothetical protein VNI00_010584 [Paramarasmius palmivorus]|uniref:Cytochrome P450 n=1 Tax=Paramarasmius palmivorus TaxID=297713 RepID=A0AAW0CKH3_9AGAR